MKRCNKWYFVWMRCSGGVIIWCRHLVTVNKCVVWRTANAGIKYQVTLTWRQTNDNDWPSLRESIWSYVLTATSSVVLRTHSHSDADSVLRCCLTPGKFSDEPDAAFWRFKSAFRPSTMLTRWMHVCTHNSGRYVVCKIICRTAPLISPAVPEIMLK